ncbi:MAG: hypothetical protein U1D06_07095 [Paracoccaceae bacterium]|nr:hypothetical protein [Paracoccaceae bacterium]
MAPFKAPFKSPAVRRFTATVAAAATAFALMTAAAVPARANSDDVARALAAIAAIAIVGTVIKNNKKDQGTAQYREQNNNDPFRYNQPRYDEPRYDERRYEQSRRHDARRGVALPNQCLIEVKNRGRTTLAYSEYCLRRNGIDNRLPRQCEIDVRQRGRTSTAYSASCLADAGFRTRRH